MPPTGLTTAARAFDASAATFDERFMPWSSVQAQRDAVRQALADAFPTRSRLIEIGGGTGEDALWLARRGHRVLLTDASPTMIEAARAKHGNIETAVAAAEEFEQLADRMKGSPAFDGAYSVFAALNCVSDLSGFARGLARLLRPGAQAMLVMFGTFCPGEIVVELVRGRPRNALRRFRRGDVPARVGDARFTIRYHRARDLEGTLAPHFRLESRQGIGIFVPPSAAEPWISRQPRLLQALQALDRVAERPMAVFGDHVLYRFVRTGT